MKKFLSIPFLIALYTFISFSRLDALQTITEKKQSLEQTNRCEAIDPEIQDELDYVNEELLTNRELLAALYHKAYELFSVKAPQESYQTLIQQIKCTKQKIAQVEEMWRDDSSHFLQNEGYSLWHQPDTTILQLVMDYGGQDYVYIVPPEIGMIHISVTSSLPIPREAWGNMLELILQQNGIGVKQLNSFMRELYLSQQNPALGIEIITEQVSDLELLSETSRVCFVLCSENFDARATLTFLEKFSNPQTTSLQIIGGKVFITSSRDTVKELLKLYEFTKKGQGTQDFQLVSLKKINAKEMEVILNSAFHECTKIPEGGEEAPILRIIPLAQFHQSLFISGAKEDVSKAVKMIQDLEAQIENPRAKTVYWYSVKHSDPEDLALVLARVYDLLCAQATVVEGNEGNSININNIEAPQPVPVPVPLDPPLVVTPPIIGLANEVEVAQPFDGQNNFIVDAKTGSIIMVVEHDVLPKIKELLRKLDVPKKMVQIEVLLFEKKVTNQNNFGLNLLRIGSAATNTHATSLLWNLTPFKGAGILEFLISRKKTSSGIPAYDVAYNFLLSQEDVQINAAPSITTINQTPATIAIVEEISINTGVIETDNNHNNNTVRDSYARAQYGITIQITPTINIGDDLYCDDGISYVTLDTDITFDTPKKNSFDRPDVTRRHIKNHVRIADGQTVILGGLRRKSTHDNKDTIPFLGEIPGIGKLFSTTGISDSSTEMFVFLTPKIISDPLEDLERIKCEELQKRPGDLPEYVYEVIEAKNREKKKLFQQSLTALFGRQEPLSGPYLSCERCDEYDGR